MKIKYTKKGRLTAESKRHLSAVIAKKRCDYKPPLDSPINYWFHEKPKLEREINQALILLPLKEIDITASLYDSKTKYPRKQNWLDPVPGFNTYINEVSFQYKGAHKGRWGSNFQPVVKSFCRISGNQKDLFAVIRRDGMDIRKHVHAGQGYCFNTDENGVRMVKTSTGDDIHISSSILDLNFTDLRTELLENAAKRKATMIESRNLERKYKAITKKYGKEWVGFGDSIAAGNCLVGTRNFCSRYNLDTTKHYRVDQLPEPHNRLVSIAATAARRRHLNECKLGYCTI